MKHLHETAFFNQLVSDAAEKLGIPVPIVEKDYYVTMILRRMAEKTDCVFKGGTSLSKCFHIIDRFSEDIDITFSRQLSQGERKKLKHNVIESIGEELHLPIVNLDDTHSRLDFNCYQFAYASGDDYDYVLPTVKMEVVLSSVSTPYEAMYVDNLLREYLETANPEMIREYGLDLFRMNVQCLERTFIEKVFAICDYHLAKEYDRRSRHIYDIYMMYPKISFDTATRSLIEQVRTSRATLRYCPSAKQGVDVSAILEEIVRTSVYKKDYERTTSMLVNHYIDYDEVIAVIEKIAGHRVF